MEFHFVCLFSIYNKIYFLRFAPLIIMKCAARTQELKYIIFKQRAIACIDRIVEKAGITYIYFFRTSYFNIYAFTVGLDTMDKICAFQERYVFIQGRP